MKYWEYLYSLQRHLVISLCDKQMLLDLAKNTEQGRRSMKQHTKGLDKGKTCIDCHKGIAHSLPAMYEVDPSAAVEVE